jgi:hypothetical protein
VEIPSRKVLDRLKAVGARRPRAGPTYSVQFFAYLVRIGFVINRRQITRSTGKLSLFTHSFDSFDRYADVVGEFASFCREPAEILGKVTWAEAADVLPNRNGASAAIHALACSESGSGCTTATGAPVTGYAADGGTSTSLVPEPEMLLLLGFGLGLPQENRSRC